MTDNEKIAKELLEKFKEHYKRSPSVMNTIKKVIYEVLEVKEDGTAQ